MNKISTKLWVRIALLNFIIVSMIGVLMRYKIGFEFPHFNQKHLLNAHSHFAFYGWVTQILMTLIIHYLLPELSINRIKYYKLLLYTNLFCSYAMLVSFSLTGYGTLSIIFSTTSILVSYIFTVFCFKDFKVKKEKLMEIIWFKGALIFNFISTLGTFYLATMMSTKSVDQHAYLASIYWFLHFQYNGWFFFACVALFNLSINIIDPQFKFSKKVFWLFALSCIPAYGLSVLWLNLPTWIYTIVVAGAFTQLLAWIIRLIELRKFSFKKLFNNFLQKTLFSLLAICISIKFILQLGSVIPSISQLAFSFRPIVIAYLHLILLAIISVFIIAHLSLNNLISNTKLAITGILIFIFGVYLNELVLGVQGIASFSYVLIPYVNETLFGVALVIFTGLITIFLSQLRKT